VFVSEGIVAYNFIGEFVLALMLEIKKGLGVKLLRLEQGLKLLWLA